MKIKQLSEILNVDIRRAARQKFKKDLDVSYIDIKPLLNGGHQVSVRFYDGGETLNFEFDCHGHKVDG